jgi:hypothetical protein
MLSANRLSETDHLRLQLASERATRCAVQADLAWSVARGAAAALEQEKARILAAYEVVGSDAVDIDTGVITRAPPPPRGSHSAGRRSARICQRRRSSYALKKHLAF